MSEDYEVRARIFAGGMHIIAAPPVVHISWALLAATNPNRMSVADGEITIHGVGRTVVYTITGAEQGYLVAELTEDRYADPVV